MLCAINWWFYRWTKYPGLTVILVSLAFWLAAGVAVGLGFYRNARGTPEEQHQRRLELMRRGPVSFVWRYGVLTFGGAMFLAFSALILLTLQAYPRAMFAWLLGLCLLGGIISGVVLWSILEEKYR